MQRSSIQPHERLLTTKGATGRSKETEINSNNTSGEEDEQQQQKQRARKYPGTTKKA